jgi:hypothetical protein
VEFYENIRKLFKLLTCASTVRQREGTVLLLPLEIFFFHYKYNLLRREINYKMLWLDVNNKFITTVGRK